MLARHSAIVKWSNSGGEQMLLAMYNHTCICGANSQGEVLTYINYMGMCRSEGYGFQAVQSEIRYKNQSALVYN